MNTKDWNGNTTSIFKTIGASNHTDADREKDDYYATDPKALEMLLQYETFNHHIWEPACGGGHLSKVLTSKGYDVLNSDIVDRGYDGTQIIDFLKVSKFDDIINFKRDIITNPPYKYAKEFVEKALDISKNGTKIAMFLKLTFLEGQGRRTLFESCPPQTVYVFSKRVECAKGGIFTGGSAVCYAWFIWCKGYIGCPEIKWL